jgi:MFS family permease
MTTVDSSRVFAGNQWKLSLAQLFSGVGIAVGFAVGGLLAEELTGQAEYAGFAQTASIIGAGVLAIPLARLAARRSRRHSLSLGFAIALVGAVTILAGARLGSPVIFFVGMFLFGSATATGLQTRYAATDNAPPHLRGRALSIVVWATTIGSVAGPNLAGPGGVVGERLGVGQLGGPFALSAVAFLIAIGFTMVLRAARRRRDDAAATGTAVASGGDDEPAGAPPTTAHTSLADALRIVVARPRALLGFAAVVLGHTVMVSVMVMTPVHMSHHGDSIEVIGIVISMHILGMYALSPVYGYLSDRFGPVPVIWAGFTILTAAAALGILDDAAGSSMPRISTALTLLGLGWSACFIAGSTLLTASVPESHRVVIQGAADAGMNLGAAAFAAAAGPLLAVGGFTLINIAALGIVAVGVAVAVRSLRAHRRTEAAQAGG